jgi:polysaccharide deacetylase family protein (PEP-CTERM system associated)
MINALTFDIEEYFHAEVFAGVVRPEEWPTLESRVVGATEHLLDLLDEARSRATFFVLGWVAERQPRLVRTIAARGHEIACHGYGHQMITRQSRAQFEGDVRRAKAAVEEAAGVAVIGYRAPTFSVVRETLWSLEVLVETGFRYDSSIFPIVHDRYGIPNAPRFPHRVAAGPGMAIAEFPLSTVAGFRWRFPVAGGGYFRLWPYAVTGWALRHLNTREGQPAMVYLHPWEIDAGQPRLAIGRRAHFRHSVNTGVSTVTKLRRLLRDFRFAPVRDVLAGTGVMTSGRAA